MTLVISPDNELAQYIHTHSLGNSLELQLKLQGKTSASIHESLLILPRHVKSLDLSWNSLETKTVEDLIDIFSAIPDTVTTLFLSANGLGERPVEELREILAALPHSIIELHLECSEFRNLTPEEIKQKLTVIPLNVRSLNLLGNDFERRNVQEIKKIFLAIPSFIENLEIYRINRSQMKPVNELEEIISSFPECIKSVCMDFSTLVNNMENSAFPADDIIRMTAVIPRCINTLDLSYSQFHYGKYGLKLSDEELIRIFKAIPPWIEVLNLSETKIGVRYHEVLKKIINSIPNVVTINITKCSFNNDDEVFNLLAQSGKRIIVDDMPEFANRLDKARKEVILGTGMIHHFFGNHGLKPAHPLGDREILKSLLSYVP